ncbi:MAG: hypothetical protein GYA59_13855, partial [Chloroflexi bacterium]|nr:hypothetical protein [Chloroflexota bacterium]
IDPFAMILPAFTPPGDGVLLDIRAIASKFIFTEKKDFTPPLTPPQGGELERSSDYDVAILDPSPDDEPSIPVKFQHALTHLLKTERVDVVSLKRAPVELAYHVISTGKLLYQKDMYARVEFEAQVLGKYGDYLPVLQSYKDQTLQGDAYAKRVQRYREALRRTQRTLGPARTPPRSEPS